MPRATKRKSTHSADDVTRKPSRRARSVVSDSASFANSSPMTDKSEEISAREQVPRDATTTPTKRRSKRPSSGSTASQTSSRAKDDDSRPRRQSVKHTNYNDRAYYKRMGI